MLIDDVINIVDSISPIMTTMDYKRIEIIKSEQDGYANLPKTTTVIMPMGMNILPEDAFRIGKSLEPAKVTIEAKDSNIQIRVILEEQME